MVAGQSDPYTLAMDDTHIYYTNFTGTTVVALLKAPPFTPTVLASMEVNPLGVAVDDTFVYWTEAGHVNCTLGDDDGIGAVRKIPKGGGAPITIAGSESCPDHVAVDDKFVYWTLYATGVLKRVAK
jgi:hypothetical protein